MNKSDQKFLTYKGYTGSVEFSLSDRCLFGNVVGLQKGLISYEGQTLAELEQDFQDGVNDYLSYCEENKIEPKKPFTGQFSIRLTPDLHRAVAATAQKMGMTVNRFVKEAVEHELHLKVVM